MNPSEKKNLPSYGVWEEDGTILVLTRMIKDPAVREYINTLQFVKRVDNPNSLFTVFIMK